MILIYLSLLTIGACFFGYITSPQAVPSKQLVEHTASPVPSNAGNGYQAATSSREKPSDKLKRLKAAAAHSNPHRKVSAAPSGVARIAEEEYRKLKPYQDNVNIVENQEGVFVYPQGMSYQESMDYLDNLAGRFPGKTVKWLSKGTPSERFEIK